MVTLISVYFEYIKILCKKKKVKTTQKDYKKFAQC